MRQDRLELVRAEDERAAPRGLDEERHHRLRPLGVDRGERLVGHHQLGSLVEDAGHRDPLLLAAGEPVDALVQLGRDADAREHLRHLLALAPPQRPQRDPERRQAAEPPMSTFSSTLACGTSWSCW